ncbi:MAG: class I SAM-dependent methyltransferase [Chitinophagales bacterium]|nr:class I SAM-dependent methyltransferase [Chitinophagales bacterium]
MNNTEWYKEWFNTKYYHILYKNRDFEEAELFINNLVDYLKIEKDSKILDLACGKGRHSYFLAKKGFDVTGIDLSAQSIEWAKTHYSLPNLKFAVNDMRNVYKENSFDFLFNMFTSFGYFNSHNENQRVVNSMKTQINNSGTIVIDFLNIYKVLSNIVKNETKIIDGISFNISKEIRENNIVKTIDFYDSNEKHTFVEKVEILTIDDFKHYFNESGLKIKAVFGSYQLEEFKHEHSDRLILIVTK